MKIPIFQVDAFTSKVFHGNPAAVCLLDAWPEDSVMQNIAAENNLSETAFMVNKTRGVYDLRWFTPAVEVDLCGHATLAGAYVIFNFIDKTLSAIDFETASGTLSVVKSGELLSMDFPALKPAPAERSELLSRALGREPSAVLKSRDLLAVFGDESHVRELVPDFQLLMQMKETFAVIVTAPGEKSDFVSRFFAPWVGIPEDPVTGSAHCTLIPYWAERLNKKVLHAYQLSKRGGELFCEQDGNRVHISGQAILYAAGEIYI